MFESIGYDANKKVLEVEFNNGKVYQYFGVPLAKVKAIFNGGSLGAKFNTMIKPNYKFKRVSDFHADW